MAEGPGTSALSTYVTALPVLKPTVTSITWCARKYTRPMHASPQTMDAETTGQLSRAPSAEIKSELRKHPAAAGV